jgi:hypothetical protein
MFALKRLLLNIEHVLMYVPKALAVVFSMCSLLVILLPKMTPRYLTLFTNGIFRPFSWRSSPGIVRLLEKQIAWVFPSLIFMSQRWHHDPTTVRLRCTLFNTLHSCFSVAYTQVSSTNEQSQSQSYVTTDGQSASLSWYQAPIWGLRPDFYYCQRVAGLLTWGVLSNERTGLSFTIAAGPRQRSHSRVRVPWTSRPYFPLPDLRPPLLSPPTSRRATVEVFDPASTRESESLTVI